MHLNALAFSLVVALGSFVAGFLGSLTGLGGGVVIVPLLTLLFGVDMRYAIGASLVSVIATSSGAAAAYLREGYSNMRVGMFLEIATTVGAISGAVLAGHLSTSVIAIVFGLVLLYSAYSSTQIHEEMHRGLRPDQFATLLKLDGSYPTPNGLETYHVRHVPAGVWIDVRSGSFVGTIGYWFRRGESAGDGSGDEDSV